ncbi:choline transporter-like protein 5 [Otolemur garnettii]|uniref:choline transporter-like protein 5 n=1 Tax=Otolemur garnettii TaxID=30611 RepID=UPI000643FCCE|nr:choline transporter-like protein 5 [Otolemur garnettii]
MAWVYGDPRRMAYPTDSQGHFCGQKGTPNENKSILFYFNILSCTNPSVMITLQCPTTQICVSKCPDKFLTYVKMQILYKRDKRFWEDYSPFCKAGAKPVKSLPQVILDDDCPAAVYPSKPFLQRCLPDFSFTNGSLTIGDHVLFEDGNGRMRNVTELKDAVKQINEILNARKLGLKVFQDYSLTWYWILTGLVIAMFLSWIIVILMRYIVGLLFWIFAIGVLGIIGYGIWHCYNEYDTLRKNPNAPQTLYDIGIQTDITLYFRLKQIWFAFMIMLSILEAIVVILMIFLRKRIRVAIFLLQEGSKAIRYIPSTLFYPLLTFTLLSICISYWVVTAVFLATSGIPVYKVIDPEGHCEHENETCNPEIFKTSAIAKACPGALCNFVSYGGQTLYEQYIPTFHAYNLFVLLWLINFVIALGQCSLAGAFATYYWAMNKPKDIPPHPLFTAFGRAIRYHTGSLAFGSLILATIQIFKMFLEYLDRRLKHVHNKFLKLLQHCLKCCFWCLDKVIKFLNRNAYIMIAVYGKNFCRSTRDAFNLLMRNILKVAVTDEVTFFVLFLGKILVAGSIGVLGFLFFTQRMAMIVEAPRSLNYYWVPLLTVVLGSYLIAHGFFSVYAMCVETIFLCFCEDLERNDGSTEKPYFVAPKLHEILIKKELVPQKQKRVEKAPNSLAHF